MSVTKATPFLMIVFVLLVTACSNSKHLPAGETLFKGSKVHIKDNEVDKKKGKKSHRKRSGRGRKAKNKQ